MPRSLPNLVLLLQLTLLSGCVNAYPATWLSEHNLQSSPASSPVSAALSNKQPVIPTDVAQDYINLQESSLNQFTHPQLPGFSIDFPTTWDLALKPFEISAAEFDPLDQNRSESQLQIEIKQDSVNLQLLFFLAWDDNFGYRCSNSVEFKAVGDDWYRFQDSKGVFYTNDATTDYFTGTTPNYAWSDLRPEWTYSENAEYRFCDRGWGDFLKSKPPIELSTENNGILMQKPEIVGNPTALQLAEIDAMVGSISNTCDGETCLSSE